MFDPPASQRSERSRLRVALLMVVSALAFALAASSRSGQEVEVGGVSVERGGPAPLAGDLPNTDWADAIVRIETRRCAGDHSVATGVIVDGVILTNRHVIERADSITVETLRGERYDAVSMRSSATIDMATVVVPELDGGLSLSTVPAAEGERFTMVGFPAGGQLQQSTVVVSDHSRGTAYPDSARPLRLDRVVVPGESGSPLIGADGTLGGLLYSRAFADGHGLAHDAPEVTAQWSAMTSVAFDRCS